MNAAAAKLLRNMVREGVRVRVAVRGDCMKPLLRSGDLVEIGAFDGPPKVGQIAAVYWDSRIVLHRISRAEGSPPHMRIFLRGDSHADEHGPHREDDLIGRLERVRRGAKWMGRLRWAVEDGAARAFGLARRIRRSAGMRGAAGHGAGR